MKRKAEVVLPAPEPRLLTIKSAAVYLSSTVWFMRTLVWEDRVPNIKLGKRIVFDRVDLDRYIDQLKAGA